MAYKLKDIEEKIRLKDIEKSMSATSEVIKNLDSDVDSKQFSKKESYSLDFKPVVLKQSQKKTNLQKKKQDKFDIFIKRLITVLIILFVSIFALSLLVKMIYLLFS